MQTSGDLELVTCNYNVTSLEIALEQYHYWRSEGLLLKDMIEAVNGICEKHGVPQHIDGVNVVYWLAAVWDGLAKR